MMGASNAVPSGTVLGGRFQIGPLLGAGGLGQLYRAMDLEAKRPVAVRVLAPDICADEGTLNNLRELVRAASALQHKNIAAVYGMGVEGQLRFVAMEFVEGTSLRGLLQKRRAAGKPFSMRSAYNVVAHVCNALHHVHPAMVHGLPGPGAVLVNQAGRVKVTEFGVLRAFPAGANVLGRLGDRYCLAPEVMQDPGAAGPAGDIHCLGMMLFELVTGQRQPTPGVAPTRLMPGLPPTVDKVLERCLHPDPSKRFPDTRELKAAFYAVVQEAEANPAPAPAAPTAGPPAPSPRPAPAVQAPAAQPLPAPTMASAPLPQPSQPPRGGAPGRQRTLQELMAEGNTDATEKWLVQKDRLDFGPFCMADVKQRLLRGEFTGDDMVVDQENGERSRIRSHRLFQELIVQLEPYLESQRMSQAEEQRRQQERRRRNVIISVVSVSLVLLAAGAAVTAYYLFRKPKTEERIIYRDRDKPGSLIKGIQVTWNAEPEDQAKQRKHMKRRPVRKAGNAGAADDVTDLGDASKEGGDELLSQKVVQSTMAQNFSKLEPCVRAAAARDPGLRQVVIEFGIRGTGIVSSVQVNRQATGPFPACVFAKMQTIKFPSFNGPLTRAVFSMNLQY